MTSEELFNVFSWLLDQNIEGCTGVTMINTAEIKAVKLYLYGIAFDGIEYYNENV